MQGDSLMYYGARMCQVGAAFAALNSHDHVSRVETFCCALPVQIQGYNSFRTYVQKDADGKPSSRGVFAIKDAKEVRILGRHAYEHYEVR